MPPPPQPPQHTHIHKYLSYLKKATFLLFYIEIEQTILTWMNTKESPSSTMSNLSQPKFGQLFNGADKT